MKRHPTFTLTLTLACVFASLTPLRAAEEDEFEKTLVRERWREGAFGVSLRPPLGTNLRTRNIDNALLRITKDDKYIINVMIKNTQQELTVDQVVKMAIEQFGFAQPAAAIDHQRVAKPAGRPGWIIYFGVNLPTKSKPEDQRDIKALREIARAQLETANRMRGKQQDFDAFRLYKAIAANSPDPDVAKKAKQWVASYEVDNGFMARFMQDEAARRRNNPIDVGNKPWYMGQAFMQLAPDTFVVLQLEVGAADYQEVRAIFESMVKSIEVKDPRELDEERKKLLIAGGAIDGTLNHKRLKEAMLPEVTLPIVDDEGKPAGSAPLRIQYTRIIEAGKDVGWMKTVHRERRDNIVVDLETEEVRDPKTQKVKKVRRAITGEQGVNGISVDAYTRYHVGPRAVDSHHTSFLAEHGNYESWSIRTTVRDRIDANPDDAAKNKAKVTPARDAITPAPNAVKGKDAPALPRYHIRTWLETGVQHKEQITIIREGPTGLDRIQWRKPLDGYITQTELYLINRLLPRKDATYGFYAYYPNSGKVSFRTLKVVPDGAANAGFRIYSRPAPDAPEQMYEYDAKGAMHRLELGEGRELIPTTREELAKIWHVDLPDETAVPAKPEDDKPLPATPGRIPR